MTEEGPHPVSSDFRSHFGFHFYASVVTQGNALIMLALAVAAGAQVESAHRDRRSFLFGLDYNAFIASL